MINLQSEVQALLTAGRGKTDLSTKTVEVLDTVLAAAVQERASDIHIEPLEDSFQVRFRIDGQLLKVLELENKLNINVINCLAVVCNMHTDAAMKRTAQDGRFTRMVMARNYDFRVSTFPTLTGEKMTIRVLYEDTGLYDIANLGLNDYDLNRLEKLLQRKEGLVLVTGPTASGKTTTLYAILNRLNSIHKNIVTLENPVEYRMPGMNQCDINARANFSFADGLRAILRQDPDVILVGESRDQETVDITIRAAVTGHLVFSTLHARSSIGTVVRLMSMGLEPFMISYALNGTIAQRLVRRICTQCKTAYKPDEKLLKHIRDEYKLDLIQIFSQANSGSKPPAQPGPLKELTLYKGAGCEYCNKTGYRGRIAVFEILLINEELREAILRHASMKELQIIALAGGFRTLAMDGLLKAKEGLTTLEEVSSVLMS